MTVFLLFLCVGIFLMVRWTQYRSSVCYRARQGLSAELQTIQAEHSVWSRAAEQIQARMNEAPGLQRHAEAAVREATLAPRKAVVLDVENLRQFKGIGRDTVSLLRSSGYATADRLDQTILRLPGIGPAKGEKITAAARQLQAAANVVTPTEAEQAAITEAHQKLGQEYAAWLQALHGLQMEVAQAVQFWYDERQTRMGVAAALAQWSFLRYAFQGAKAEAGTREVLARQLRPMPATGARPPAMPLAPSPPKANITSLAGARPEGQLTSPGGRFVAVTPKTNQAQSPPSRQPTAQPSPPKQSQRIHWKPGSQFVSDSLRYREPVTRPARYVPFQQYWPTFASLTPDQLAYYRWWRTEWLAGRQIPTDLSYVFIFIYELFNLSFDQDPSRAFATVSKVYEDYRTTFPNLWNYAEWVGDFAWELGMEEAAVDWYGRDDTTIDVALSLGFERGIQVLSAPLLLDSFGFRRSAHFAQYEQEITTLIEQALAEADGWCQTNMKCALLNGLAGGKFERSTRSLYPSAIIERHLLRTGPRFALYRSTPVLANGVQSLLRLVENIHRASSGNKRRLQIAEEALPAGLVQHLTERLQARVQRSAPRPEIVFDEAVLASIKADSHATLGLLQDVLAEEPEETTQVPPVQTGTPNSPTSPAIGASSLQDLFGQSQTKGSMEDLFAELTPDQQGFLRLLGQSGRVDKVAAIQFVKERGGMFVSFVDGINEAALEPLGDVLLEEDEDELLVCEGFGSQFIAYWRQREAT
jgi:hypothetical protein